jgi:hypothetical protein
MHMSRRLWAIVAVLALSGCAGEDASPPPASSPSPKPTAGPAAPAEGISPAKPSETRKPEPGAAGSTKDHSGPADAPPLEAPKTGAAPADAAKTKFSEKQLANIKQLPESEQAAAIKQGVCPVSGGTLGSMGMPMKITAEGRTFYLCCDNCEDKVKADPKAIVAKLDKK